MNNKFDKANKILKILLNFVEARETPNTLEKVSLALQTPEQSNQHRSDVNMEETDKQVTLLSRPPPHLVSKLSILQGLYMLNLMTL